MMSKQISQYLRPLAGGLLVLLLLVAGLAFDGRALAYAVQGVGTATGTTRGAAIAATTAAVLKETSDLRELSILRNVKSGAQSRADIERMVIKNMDEESSPSQMHSTEVVLKKFGLAPPEFEYRTFVIKLLTEQVAGYYDPKAQQFYLADWIDLEGQKPVMAHELTHALQDQHFNLRRFEKWPKGDSDAELAAHSLIEGDATLAMTLYMAKNPMVALAFMKSLGSEAAQSEQYKQAPRAIRESLVFPYEEGSAWATQVYRKGGWQMVSDAFAKLPESTEQILHPDKYFAHEAPVKVSLPEFGAALGTGWKRGDYDVNGEWGYYLILEEFLGDTAESKKAAAGWAGDRYAMYEGPKPGEVFIAQQTAWDTENDAREFFDAYGKRTAARYANLNIEEVAATKENESRREWKTSQGRVIMELRGTRVSILEGLPDNADSKQFLNLVWQSSMTSAKFSR